ncbi:MAG TPA: prolipoprotein diacylglyceryl transferase [Candidatus Binataceae bacterium]|nr:prolipoprotein diacylglyceryl transferase [Candidatus Binataceae bacterium]
MIPVLLRLGPITIYSYGLMMALGFLAADFVIALECRRRGIASELASALVVWGAIVGLAGARLLDIFNHWPSYWADPKSMIFSGSGFVWYGGLIGGITAAYFVSRHFKVRFAVTADMCAPALAVGQALGRVGCQLSGDGDWGAISKVPWAMAYPHAIVGWIGRNVAAIGPHNTLIYPFPADVPVPPGVRVHPAPVYETILYLIVFAILWSMRRRTRIDGRLFYLYLMLAGLSRFMVEFVRINPRVLFELSEAQLIAIVMMVVGAAAWIVSGVGTPHRAVIEEQGQAVGA